MADDANFEIIKNTYTEDYCSELELAYGDHMMSDGGAEAIDHMFEGIDLTNKKMLDFGSGIGGVVFYLAGKHNAQVTGVEINERMIADARKRTPQELRDKVTFVLTQDGMHLPFADATFDVVYSKGVIVHLTVKQRCEVFKEFYRVLKPGGQLIINDWLSEQDGVWSEKVLRLIETEALPLYAVSPSTYKGFLEEVGFSVLSLTDCSDQSAAYNDAIVQRLESPAIKEAFIKKCDEKTWQEHVQGYRDIAAVNRSREAVTILIVAQK